MTLNDIHFLQDWIEAYDGEASPENSASQERILEWAKHEVAKRERAGLVRAAAKRHNITVAQASKALRSIGH